MRITALLIVVLIAAAVTSVAVASPPGDLRPAGVASPKTDGHVGDRPARDSRQGGETIADAVPIPDIPYTDSGATCDNIDDYDEICPYTGSTAPDVVYSFTPEADMVLRVDLCGSEYDTKLYIYDEGLNLVACNDDYYFDDVCGMYVSALPFVPFNGGVTYYIVVDGYSSDCGEYILELYDTWECFLECPDVPDVMYENEPPLEDGYVDSFNSGCGNAGEPVFSDLIGSGEGTVTFCAKTGWFDDFGWDTDWIRVVAGATGQVVWEGDAEWATFMFRIAPTNCEDGEPTQMMEVGPCLPATMTIDAVPGEVIWLWVGPQDLYPPPGFVGHEYDYVMTLDGIQPGPVATVNRSWSAVKSLYR